MTKTGDQQRALQGAIATCRSARRWLLRARDSLTSARGAEYWGPVTLYVGAVFWQVLQMRRAGRASATAQLHLDELEHQLTEFRRRFGVALPAVGTFAPTERQWRFGHDFGASIGLCEAGLARVSRIQATLRNRLRLFTPAAEPI